MYRNSLFAVVILSIMTACSVKEQYGSELVTSPENKQEGVKLEFTATTGIETETKTTLIQDGELPGGQPRMITWWCPEEEICIYYGASAGNKFTSTNTELVQTATFSGTLNAFTGLNESGDFNYFWAVYPYDAAVSCDGESVVAILADEQVAYAGSYANNTNVTIAKSAGLSLGFYNVCSYLRFTVETEGVISATLRGNNYEYVAGQFRVSMDNNGRPTAPVIIDGERSVTLRRPNNEPFVVGTSYYFTILPQTFESGFTVQFNTETETGSRVINASATFARNSINYGVTAFDHGVEYISVVPSDEIWYTTSDGSIYNYQSGKTFGATYVSNTYEDGKGVIKFSGPVTKIVSNSPLMGNYKVTSLMIPESVTELGYGALYGLTNLTSFDIPGHVETIRSKAIFSCNSLTSLTIPESVETIESGAVVGCTNLERFIGSIVGADERYIIVNNQIRCFASGNLSETDIVIPASITSIGTAFSYSSITSITLNDKITTLSPRALQGCSDLESVIFTVPVTSLGMQSLDDCQNLSSFVGPNASADGKLIIIDNVACAFAMAYSSFTIPEGVVNIDFNSVYNRAISHITELYLPRTINAENTSIFDIYRLDALTNIHFSLASIPYSISLPLRTPKINVIVPICMEEAFRQTIGTDYYNIIGSTSKMRNDVVYSVRWNGGVIDNHDFYDYEFDYFDINDFGANVLSRTRTSYYDKDTKYYEEVMDQFDANVTRIGYGVGILDETCRYFSGHAYTVWIPATVTDIEDSLYSYEEGSVVYLYFLGTTPPNIIYNSMMATDKYYFMVPSSALSAYKTKWSYLSSRIFGY